MTVVPGGSGRLQHVGEQVDSEHRVAVAAHRGGDITIERETAARLIAGFPDLPASCEVDLEPVPRAA